MSFADIRLISTDHTSAQVQDGRADRLASGTGRGAGIRVLVDGAWGFCGSERLTARALEKALDEAIDLARASAPHVKPRAEVAVPEPVEDRETFDVRIDPRSVDLREKARRIQELEAAGRAAGNGKISNSIVGYADMFQRQILCNTAGSLIESEVIRTMVTATYTASEAGVMQRARKAVANVTGYELVTELDAETFSVEVSRKAVRLLKARRPPVGTYPVVFHPSITGLLMHEALGHNAEADLVWTGESILAGKLGEQIASPLVTVVDDSTLPHRYGSYRYDSEGTPGQRRLIIDRGRLVGFLHTLETARKLGVRPNGNGRAQDYLSRPIVRMSNTFMERGTSKFEDLLRGIDRGIYLKDGQWGYVFVDKGQFTCHADQAQMIENGQLGEPLRDVTVSGMMLEALMDIKAVGDDFEMDMPGMCGKGGQGAPVDAGGPHVRVAKLVVGGV